MVGLVTAFGVTTTSQFMLQVAALVTGGGIVQLTIFLLRRRSELQALDRTSSKPLLEEQGAFIDRLQASEIKARSMVDALETRLESERKDFAQSLRMAHAENERLAREVANLRTELDIAQGQIERLTRQQRGRDA